MQNNETHFLLIVAIIGAGLWLRHSLTPSYVWIVVILLGAAGWLIHSAKRDWRRLTGKSNRRRRDVG